MVVTGVDATPRLAHDAIQIGLMRGFDLAWQGASVAIPVSAQRVVAYLALRDRPAVRSLVAGTLWLEATEERALGNLRSALWRLRQSGCHVVVNVGDRLSLSGSVTVDVRVLAAQARRIVAGAEILETFDVDRLVVAGELLPDWYEDWVVIDRERVRQLRLHALERACERLAAMGRYGEAIDAGLAAVAEEPLHESAHRALIQAHLAEGNRVEALRQFEAYARAMWNDLHLEPSVEIRALIEETGRGVPRSRVWRGVRAGIVTTLT